MLIPGGDERGWLIQLCDRLDPHARSFKPEAALVELVDTLVSRHWPVKPLTSLPNTSIDLHAIQGEKFKGRMSRQGLSTAGTSQAVQHSQ